MPLEFYNNRKNSILIKIVECDNDYGIYSLRDIEKPSKDLKYQKYFLCNYGRKKTSKYIEVSEKQWTALFGDHLSNYQQFTFRDK